MKNNLLFSLSIACLALFTTPLVAASGDAEKLVKLAIKEVGEIEPKALKALIDEEEVILLDVREIEEKVDGDIFAIYSYAITRGNLEFYITSKIKDKNAVIVTYCRGGNRGALAAQTLKRMGYKNATSLKGGLRGWVKAGYPIFTELGTFTIDKKPNY